MESDPLFYDSLEDEEAPELLPLHHSPNESDISNISLTVPLYTKETSKNEVLSQKSHDSNQSKNSRSKLTLPSQTNLQFQPGKSNKSSTSCLNQLILDPNRTKKSYVDLFHAKIGYVQGSETTATDTNRAVCDDDSFKTARSSAASDYSDAETTSSFISDTSFYKKFLENEELLADQMSSVSCSGRSTRSVISKICKTGTGKNSKSNSIVTGITEKSSISATVLPSKPAKGHARGKIDRALLKVPTLGGLGPDREATREKLDRLKRQQKYGQKVSNQNRVKIMEMKVMKNFKYELKKSSDLNKCAESVLNT